MKIYENEYVKFMNGDCQEIIKTIPSEPVNVILTDPPYLYLKNQVLERPFNEYFLFQEFARILKPGGFIVMFGRGSSFYRWNTILTDIIQDKDGGYGKIVTDRITSEIINRKGWKRVFDFKEEIIWDKMQISSPLNPLMRVHENISIHTKGKATINKIKTPLVEAYKFEPKKVYEAIYRLTTTFGNFKTFDLVKKYFETGETEFNEGKLRRFNTTVSSEFPKRNRTLQFAVNIQEGITERSIMREVRDHYTSIHPTQKPVGLLKRLLALVIKSENDVVADFFAGSASMGEACMDMKLKCILTEIHEPYYNLGVERLDKVYRDRDTQTKLF